MRRSIAHASVVAALLIATIGMGFFPITVSRVTPSPALAAAPISLPGLASSAPKITVSSIGAAPVPLTVVSPPVKQESVLPAADTTQQTVGTLQNAARNSVRQTGTAVSTREQALIPLFYRHVVEVGDTVTSIAATYGVGREYILWNNIDVIDDQNVLQPGMLLQIPSVPGIIHAVRIDDTLTDIAAQYDANVKDIIAFPANDISDPNDLPENRLILVPGGRVLPKPAPTLRPEPTPQVTAPSVPAPNSSATGFIWPVLGLITSNYGPSHPLGIDINAPYVPVVAASSGQIVFAGGDRCCSYGLYIEIQHGGNYSTRYAHLSQFSVGVGEWVEQGQVIGVSGSTGNSTGAHLHLEFRRNGQIVNPMSFLP